MLLPNELYLESIWLEAFLAHGSNGAPCILNESNFMEVMNVAIGNVNKRKLQRNYFVFEATADIINLTSQNF